MTKFWELWHAAPRVTSDKLKPGDRICIEQWPHAGAIAKVLWITPARREIVAQICGPENETVRIKSTRSQRVRRSPPGQPPFHETIRNIPIEYVLVSDELFAEAKLI